MDGDSPAHAAARTGDHRNPGHISSLKWRFTVNAGAL
jgi:hypothetical protein